MIPALGSSSGNRLASSLANRFCFSSAIFNWLQRVRSAARQSETGRHASFSQRNGLRAEIGSDTEEGRSIVVIYLA